MAGLAAALLGAADDATFAGLAVVLLGATGGATLVEVVGVGLVGLGGVDLTGLLGALDPLLAERPGAVRFNLDGTGLRGEIGPDAARRDVEEVVEVAVAGLVRGVTGPERERAEAGLPPGEAPVTREAGLTEGEAAADLGDRTLLDPVGDFTEDGSGPREGDAAREWLSSPMACTNRNSWRFWPSLLPKTVEAENGLIGLDLRLMA